MNDTLEYLPELGNIRQFMHTQSILKEPLPFPYGYGPITSLFVARIVPQLTAISGELILGGKPIPHTWNYDKEHKLYIDLTAQQFGKSQPEILTLRDDQGMYRAHSGVNTPANSELESKVNALEVKYNLLKATFNSKSA